MTNQDSYRQESYIALGEEEVEGYFLLIREAVNKQERHEIRRECFQLLQGGKETGVK
jgi:hypothetical protein